MRARQGVQRTAVREGGRDLMGETLTSYLRGGLGGEPGLSQGVALAVHGLGGNL